MWCKAKGTVQEEAVLGSTVCGGEEDCKESGCSGLATGEKDIQ